MVVFRRVVFRLSYVIIIISLVFISIFVSTSIRTDDLSVIDCEKVCPYSSKLINGSIRFDSSHIIRHYPDFVCPQNFRNLADWIFEWPDQFEEHLEQTTDNAKILAPCLPTGSIIYVRTWEIDKFFRRIYPQLINEFVLITGESDFSSPSHLQYLEQSDSKIIHWFGQNGQYNNQKFTHIPIGINCYEMAQGIQHIYSQHLNHTVPPVFGEYDEPLRYIQPFDVAHRVQNNRLSNENLVLINFDSGTDRTGLRSRIWRDMCGPENNKTYPFITCLTKQPGVQINSIPKIYERNRQYPFWLAPRGNGIDCHRTWEALYLDIIPIVWNSTLNILYQNLPVLIINDHKALNKTFLDNKLREISSKKLSGTTFYQYEKLRHAYWRRLILSKSRHKKTKDIYQRKEQCWRAKIVL